MGCLSCRWSQWVSATLPDLRRLRWRVVIGGCRRRMRMRSGRGCGPVMRPSRRRVRWDGRPRGVRGYLVRCGGIRPAPRRRSPGRLSLAEREEISRGLAAGLSLRAIAAGLGRAPSTISREVAAHGGRGRYRAAPADQQAWARARRPQACKLATHPALRAIVGEQLKQRVVTAADRRLAEDHLSRRPGDAGVARDDLPHPVHPVPRRPTQGADRSSAHRAGDPTPGRALGCPMVVVAGRGSSTSPNAPPRPTTGRCPGTGKATWSSANA